MNKPNNKLGIPDNRIVERKQGCWNCTGYDCNKARDVWWKKVRGEALAKAVEISLSSPQGEEDVRVRNLRRMVPQTDVAIENETYGVCTRGGVESTFVASTYLCGKWSGKQGASVARGAEAQDILPEELQERVDKDGLQVKTWQTGPLVKKGPN